MEKHSSVSSCQGPSKLWLNGKNYNKILSSVQNESLEEGLKPGAQFKLHPTPLSPTGCSDRSLPAYIWALFRPFGRFSVSEPQQHITLKILLLTAERGAHGVICRWYFPFIARKFRSVRGAAARRRRVSLWTDGIVIKSSGNNKALHLLLICLIFFFPLPLTTRHGVTQHVPCSCERSGGDAGRLWHGCWSHLDLARFAWNKSRAWKGCSGCQQRPICSNGIVAQRSGCDSAAGTRGARPWVRLQWPQRPVLIS